MLARRGGEGGGEGEGERERGKRQEEEEEEKEEEQEENDGAFIVSVRRGGWFEYLFDHTHTYLGSFYPVA